jgi:hypothetical protein
MFKLRIVKSLLWRQARRDLLLIIVHCLFALTVTARGLPGPALIKISLCFT